MKIFNPAQKILTLINPLDTPHKYKFEEQVPCVSCNKYYYVYAKKEPVSYESICPHCNNSCYHISISLPPSYFGGKVFSLPFTYKVKP